ncbi:MAG: hypothetical protein VX374_00325, partial [Pseudomonadota bacterium]|nr:hypothetical protein [Pseudomonadota bacterium]
VGCAIEGVKNFELLGPEHASPPPDAAALAAWAEGCLAPGAGMGAAPPPPPDVERHVATAYCSQHPLFHQLPHLLQHFCVPAYGLGRIGMAPPNRNQVTANGRMPD